MSKSAWFWLIYVGFLIVAAVLGYRSGNRTMGVFGLVLFILVGIIGVAVFDWPIR